MQAWCSWCGMKAEHQLVKTNVLERDEYQCLACKNFTVPCRVPNCEHMARFKPQEASSDWRTRLSENWASERCAEHDGTVANFSRLNLRISALENYADLYERSESKLIDVLARALPAQSDDSALSAYASYRKIADFGLHKVRDGQGPPLVFINGLLSGHVRDYTEWIEPLQQRFPNNPCYGVTWDAGSLYKIIGSAAQCVALGRLRGLAVAEVLHSWHEAQLKAQLTGKVLAEILRSTDFTHKPILFGHSLGACVIFHTLNTLGNTYNSCVSDVYLLGGAVTKDASKWDKARYGMDGWIFNVYSTNDSVLYYMYQIAQLGEKPVGYYGLSLPSGKVSSLDASAFVGGHTKYREAMRKIFSSLPHN